MVTAPPPSIFHWNQHEEVVGLNRGVRASILQYSIEINAARRNHQHQPQLTTPPNDSPEITTVEVSWFWLRHTSEISIFLWNHHQASYQLQWGTLASLLFQYSSEIITKMHLVHGIQWLRNMCFNIPLKSTDIAPSRRSVVVIINEFQYSFEIIWKIHCIYSSRLRED